MIKFVSDLQRVSGILRVLCFFSPNKTDCHDITEILLKVALKTITLILTTRTRTKLFYWVFVHTCYQ